MNEVLQFCQQAIQALDHCHDFGQVYIKFRVEFHYRFMNGLVFSTRFGADFFPEVLDHLKTGKQLAALDGGKLGEFDRNFNQWLIQLRNSH